jgi:hypothetical protein
LLLMVESTTGVPYLAVLVARLVAVDASSINRATDKTTEA